MMESWYPGGYISPTYPHIPIINVVDALKPQLGRRKRRKWAEALTVALGQWGEAGLAFEVRVGGELTGVHCHPGCITIHAEPTLDWPNGRAGGGYWNWAEGCGAVLFDLRALFPGSLDWTTKLVTHEIGHVLGFSHGGSGIMNWSYGPSTGAVNQEERDALRSYYLEG